MSIVVPNSPIRVMAVFVNMLLAVLLFSPFSMAGDLKFLVERAETGEPLSVEEFLQMLPQAYKSNLLLGYNPRGLGLGTPEEPRIISYSPQGTSFIALQSSPEGYRGNAVEVIDFDPQTKQYTFYDIHLGAEPRVVKNPSTCMGCHRGKPLWDSYPVWPGFVGSASKPLEDSLENSPLALEYAIIQNHIINESPNPRIAAFDVNHWDPSKKPSQLTQLFRGFFNRNMNLNRRAFMLEGQRLASELEQVPLFYEYYAPLIMLLIAGRDEFWQEYGESPMAELSALQEQMETGFWQYIDEVKVRQQDNGITNPRDGLSRAYMGPALGFESQVSEHALKKLSTEYYFLVNKFGLKAKDLELIFLPKVAYSLSDGANSTHEHLWAEVAKRLIEKLPHWGEVFEIFYAMNKEEAVSRYGVDYPTAAIVGGSNWSSGNFGGSLARWHRVEAPAEVFDRARSLLIHPSSCQAKFLLVQ